MSQFEQLRLRLNKELHFNIPKDAIFTKIIDSDRKWVCTWSDYAHEISSIFTVEELLSAEAILLFNYNEIIIQKKNNQRPKFHLDIYRERISKVFGW